MAIYYIVIIILALGLALRHDRVDIEANANKLNLSAVKLFPSY